MISLDQVLLLEKKVESAVAKIAQLNAENAALRSKCAELTNALSAKTEQFSTFQTDQRLIEEGILKALNRLETVENAVLASSGVAAPKSSVAGVVSNPAVQPQESEADPSRQNAVPGTPVSTNAVPADTVSANPSPENTVSANAVSAPVQSEAAASDVVQNDVKAQPVEQISPQENVALPSENTEQNQKNPSEESSTQPLFDIF